MAVEVFKIPTSNIGAGKILGSENTTKRINLTNIFRKLLKDSGLTEDQFEDKLLDWRDKRFADESSETVIDFAMQDLRKAIASDSMAWDSFCDLLDVLGYDDVTLLV
jgi:hypothetical protein